MTDDLKGIGLNTQLKTSDSSALVNNQISSATSTKNFKRVLPRFSGLIDHSIVVWLNSTVIDPSLSIDKLRDIGHSVKIFDDSNACVDFLTDLENTRVFLLISNNMNHWIVPLLEAIPQLRAIYIFDSSQTESEHWKEGHQKVQGIFTTIDSLCDALKRDIRRSDAGSTSISILPKKLAAKLDELDQSFMYSKILKEIIIDIKHSEQAKKDFVNYCRGMYSDNAVQLNTVHVFERDYELHSPIWWYTKEPFIYATLNQALRKQDIDIIIKMGFFLQDLHQQIERIHAEHHQLTRMTIYRGQGMANVEWEKLQMNKGGLLSFNNFLSTSVDQDVSLLFAMSARDDPDLTGILFEIELQPTISSSPFALLDEISFYSDSESEVLFSMHTVFRIDNIELIDVRLWKVKLTLTSDTDQQLMHLATIIRTEIGEETTGWVRLAGLMIKMGQFDRAVQIYNTLLESMANGDPEGLRTFSPVLLSNNAVAHASLGDYPTALQYSKTMLEIIKDLLPSDHSLLVQTYNNIGTVYRLSEQYSTASVFYEKALEIVQNSFPIDNIQLANIYWNMGGIQQTLGNYSNALDFYEKAFVLDEKSFPSIHPSLAFSYFHLGHIHEAMGNYLVALSYFTKALEIEQKSLPEHHSDLAVTYGCIGDIHRAMGKYPIALTYYEKAIEIEEKHLPRNHPQRATTLNNVGEVYRSQGNDLTALSYYKKSLQIQ